MSKRFGTKHAARRLTAFFFLFFFFTLNSRIFWRLAAAYVANERLWCGVSPAGLTLMVQRERVSLVCFTKRIVFLLEWRPLEGDVRIALNFEGLLWNRSSGALCTCLHDCDGCSQLQRRGAGARTHINTLGRFPSRQQAELLMHPHSQGFLYLQQEICNAAIFH